MLTIRDHTDNPYLSQRFSARAGEIHDAYGEEVNIQAAGVAGFG
jgi:hypothetical protein